MRFLMVPATVLRAGIPAEAKLVWGAIFFLARPTGVCTKSYQEIGALVGLNKGAVMRAVSRLRTMAFLVDAGGGNGVERSFSIPAGLAQELEQSRPSTGAGSEPVQNPNRYGNGTGPLQKMNRSGAESAPPYKEEITKSKKRTSASADAEGTAAARYQDWEPPWEEPPTNG